MEYRIVEMQDGKFYIQYKHGLMIGWGKYTTAIPTLEQAQERLKEILDRDEKMREECKQIDLSHSIKRIIK